MNSTKYDGPPIKLDPALFRQVLLKSVSPQRKAVVNIDDLLLLLRAARSVGLIVRRRPRPARAVWDIYRHIEGKNFPVDALVVSLFVDYSRKLERGRLYQFDEVIRKALIHD